LLAGTASSLRWSRVFFGVMATSRPAFERLGNPD
jgi:hypothetical protein